MPWGDKAALPPQEPVDTEDFTKGESKAPASTVYLWAILMARIYEILPLVCRYCGAEMEIIAFITEADPSQRVLNLIGEPTTPPLIVPARAPPEVEADFDQTPLHDGEEAEPVPEFQYDQAISW